VVETAGGQLLTLDNRPLRYGKPGMRNPAIITIGDPSLPWTSYLQ
jgi:3'-phosphoadenosine 5'-phosphosulfate (PAPS) 3'-phosphatase